MLYTYLVWISLLISYIYCHPRFGFIHFTVSCVSFFTLIHGNNSSIRMDFLGGALIDRFVYVTNCYKFLVLSLSLSLLWGTVFFWQKRLHYNAEDRYDLTFQYSFVKHSKYYTSLINQLFILRRSCYFYSVCSVQKSSRYNFKETILFFIKGIYLLSFSSVNVYYIVNDNCVQIFKRGKFIVDIEKNFKWWV